MHNSAILSSFASHGSPGALGRASGGKTLAISKQPKRRVELPILQASILRETFEYASTPGTCVCERCVASFAHTA